MKELRRWEWCDCSACIETVKNAPEQFLITDFKNTKWWVRFGKEYRFLHQGWWRWVPMKVSDVAYLKLSGEE